jgi:hypothetical protein
MNTRVPAVTDSVPEPLVPEAAEKLIHLTEIGDLGLSRLNPIRAFKIMMLDHIINRYLAEEFNKSYNEYLTDDKKRSQSIMYVSFRNWFLYQRLRRCTFAAVLPSTIRD